jgi:hypothetical protein
VNLFRNQEALSPLTAPPPTVLQPLSEEQPVSTLTSSLPIVLPAEQPVPVSVQQPLPPFPLSDAPTPLELPVLPVTVPQPLTVLVPPEQLPTGRIRKTTMPKASKSLPKRKAKDKALLNIRNTRSSSLPDDSSEESEEHLPSKYLLYYTNII